MEAAGIEPASVDPLPSVLHVYLSLLVLVVSLSDEQGNTNNEPLDFNSVNTGHVFTAILLGMTIAMSLQTPTTQALVGQWAVPVFKRRRVFQAVAYAATKAPSAKLPELAIIVLQLQFYELRCQLDMPFRFCNPRRSQVAPGYIYII